jgi:hypothetical protein
VPQLLQRVHDDPAHRGRVIYNEYTHSGFSLAASALGNRQRLGDSSSG